MQHYKYGKTNKIDIWKYNLKALQTVSDIRYIFNIFAGFFFFFFRP